MEIKEWLFSEIGVAALVLLLLAILILYIRKLFAYHRYITQQERDHSEIKTPSPETQLNGAKKLVEFDVTKINKEINALPPYQQDEARNHYIGIRSRFSGELFLVEKENKGEIFFNLASHTQSGFPAIHCTVPEKMNPQLKFAHKGTKFTVEGDIVKYGPHDIYLKNVDILTYENEVLNKPDSSDALNSAPQE